ncbi:MAG: UDP-N-acetylmuramoyl-L-alanyl-D-glutamate--2,6-diaminopimelate ligase, partial [Pseudomonadota bacterium]
GGDRDAGKRPQFGMIAKCHCDKIYVTDDNPRTENPHTIRNAIMRTAPGAVEVADRAEAIALAMQTMQPEDILLILGKGHEQGQDFGTHIVPFDDAQTVRKIAKRLWGVG